MREESKMTVKELLENTSEEVVMLNDRSQIIFMHDWDGLADEFENCIIKDIRIGYGEDDESFLEIYI